MSLNTFTGGVDSQYDPNLNPTVVGALKLTTRENEHQDPNAEYLIKSPVVTVTNAQLLALNGTAVQVVAAPPTNTVGYTYIVDHVILHAPATTTGMTVNADNYLAIRYTNASGLVITEKVSCTGFLDQTTDQVRIIGPTLAAVDSASGGITPVAGAALVIQNTSAGSHEMTLGTGTLNVMVVYKQVPTAI